MRQGIVSLKREECPECGNRNLIHDSEEGEIVCNSCGLVITEQEIDRGPEWRAFTQAEREKRARASPQQIDLPTYINPLDRDAFGRKISVSERNKMFRLRKWQARSRYFDSVSRNLNIAQNELDRLLDILHIPPQAKELAMTIYRKSLEKRLVRGRSINAMVAASLAVACRKLQISKSFIEISAKSMADKKEVARDFRLLLKRLELRMPVHDLSMYIKKVGGNLKISETTQNRAFQILTEAQERRVISGKDPKGLAASALYIACVENNEKRTQEEIAKEAGVTEVTIRNRYKDLMKSLEIKVNLVTKTGQL